MALTCCQAVFYGIWYGSRGHHRQRQEQECINHFTHAENLTYLYTGHYPGQMTLKSVVNLGDTRRSKKLLHKNQERRDFRIYVQQEILHLNRKPDEYQKRYCYS